MQHATARVAALLLGSGLCALVYQVVWFRLLRLIFGSSTAATAATLAIFLAGLGLGSRILGPRADRRPRPLRFYADLELGLALLAAISPWLVEVAQWLYVGSGGSERLGAFGATGLRLVLATLVLGPATFLMGGTLPAAARAVTRQADVARRHVAYLYGANTLGAVGGALLTNFWALEHLGIRTTLWVGCGLNLTVALIARFLDQRATPVAAGAPSDATPPNRAVGKRLVLVAAAIAGFAFLLMELVWYRMLAPLLGGSSYTFGLILALALLGVGLGGLLYGIRPSATPPTLITLATTCAAEAFFLLLPYALGDRIAVLAMLLRPLGDISFGALILGWTAIAGIVVLPAAVVAGYQFPMLIALLGRGRQDLGHEVGSIYAWNTAGSVLGAISGGFGLIAVATAPTLWLATALLLLAVAVVAGWRALRDTTRFSKLSLPALLTVAALALLTARGPTALWRHTPIGAGGMPASFEGPSGLRQAADAVRRAILWERDGKESSIAMHGLDEISLLVSGKADGSALADAPTQVMSVLIGGALHPDPRRALVIGLGTGSSAGWLAEVEGVETIDVVELEPAIVDVARACAAVNHNAVDHPRVRLHIGDGREVLQTTSETYDLIFSEPSNPYRAGVASLFTRELYLAATERLHEDGLFLQWLQSYHVGSDVVRTVIATLVSVFPYVEAWQVHSGDLLLVASRQPVAHDIDRLRRRLAEEPFESAMRSVLGVEGAEGFYTGHLASPSLARAIHDQTPRLNTDDHPIVEFGFARGLGRDLGFRIERLAALAQQRGEGRPRLSTGALDWAQVAELHATRNAKWGKLGQPSGGDASAYRTSARNAYVLGDLRAAGQRWSSQDAPPSSALDVLLVAEHLANAGDPRALEYATRLADESQSIAAEIVLAAFEHRVEQHESAQKSLINVFRTVRKDPWVHRPTLERALELAVLVTRQDPILGLDLFHVLGEPFAVRLLDESRLRTRLEIARAIAFAALCEEALSPFEPHVPWEGPFLETRLECYETLAHPLTERARADLEHWRSSQPPLLAEVTG